jgi:regulatory protein
VPVLDAGLRLLARRAHSRAELRQKLRRRGYQDDEVEGSLARLAELGYLDDAAFAEGLVRRRSSTRGPMALSAELAAKGIDRAGAAAALAGFDPDAQLEAAIRLAERLYVLRPPTGLQETLDRIGTKLMRRGFSAGVARAACRSVVLEAREAPPHPGA